jgi:predicted ATP-grasp superfamily ATP-dependent carboligase
MLQGFAPSDEPSRLTKSPAPGMTPAVVLGSGLGALGALRLLSRAGVPVYSLSPHPSYESRSRWFRPLPGVREMLADGAPLARVLEASSLERGVLLPCSDSLLRAVSELPPAIAARFPSSTASPEGVTQLTSKAKFAALLDALDIPRPRTLIGGDCSDLEHFANGQFSDLFLKPVDSASFMRCYGVKAWRVRDVADARAQLARARAEGHPVVVQECVPGPASNHFLIDGFARANGAVHALFARRRLRMYPPEFGDSTHMISVPLTEVEPAVQSLRAILAAIRYRGIFSAEFKVDACDGTFKILEINARVWIFVEFAGRCGVDVCTMAYRDALGMPLGDIPAYRSGVRLVSPYSDLAAAHYAWSRGQLGKGAWLRSWFVAQQPLFNWTDPVPALRDWCEMSVGALRRKLRRGRQRACSSKGAV